MEKVAKETPGFIYILKSYKKTYKIGFSANPLSRISDISVSNHSIILVAIYCGSRIDERRLHRMFAEKRIKGEWFNLLSDDLFLIKKHFSGKEDIEILRNTLINTLNTKSGIRKRNPRPGPVLPYNIEEITLSDTEINEGKKRGVSIKALKCIKRFWQDQPTCKEDYIKKATGYSSRMAWGALSALRIANDV